MADYLKGTCGGIKFNPEQFHLVDGVVTAIANEELVGNGLIAQCGGIILDDGVFEVVLDGDNRYVTLATQTDTPSTFIRANCSLVFDGDLFELDDNGNISLV